MGKPSVPNAQQTAGAQTGSNINTALTQAYLNQPNQQTPWGSITSSVNGYNTVQGPNGEEYQIPRFTQTTNLTGPQQNLLDTQTGVGQQIANTSAWRAIDLDNTLRQQIGTPNYTQYGATPTLQTSIADAGNILGSFDRGGNIQMQLGDQDSWGRVQDVENVLFARYNPQLEQDRTRLETQLANQGIKRGSTAFDNAMDQQARNVNDARLGITINAGQEQNRLQQLALNSGNFANSAQAQQFGQNAALAGFTNAAQQQRYGQNANNAAFGNQAMQQMWQNQFNTTQANNGLQDSAFANDIARRNQLVNEQSALMNGQQVNMPQFGSTPQTSVGGTDVGSLINQQYQQQLAQNNNMWGGIGQLGAAAMPWLLSDERAKTDIKKIGTMGRGVPLVEYRYKGTDQPQVGVLAQDAEKVVPSAVRTRPDGFKEVNYPRLRMALGV
jgi:hypothetical protein